MVKMFNKSISIGKDIRNQKQTDFIIFKGYN